MCKKYYLRGAFLFHSFMQTKYTTKLKKDTCFSLMYILTVPPIAVNGCDANGYWKDFTHSKLMDWNFINYAYKFSLKNDFSGFPEKPNAGSDFFAKNLLLSLLHAYCL